MQIFLNKKWKKVGKKDTKIITISGVNGIGKSYFLKELYEKNCIMIFEDKYKKYNNQFSMNNNQFSMNNNQFSMNNNQFSMKMNDSWIYFANNSGELAFMNKMNNSYTFRIGINDGNTTKQGYHRRININEYINTINKENYYELLSRFRSEFSKFANLITKKNTRLSNNHKNIDKEKILKEILDGIQNSSYSKMIDYMNDFLNDKEIEGLDEELSNIKYSNKYGNNPKKGLLKANELSDGEKIMFALSSIFLETNHAEENENLTYELLFIWDEPELHLHPIWSSKIIDFILKYLPENAKLIIVSHSPQIILKSLLHNDISLMEFERKNNKVNLKLLEKNEDFSDDFKEAFMFDSKSINEIRELEGRTLYVEGESDKLYLKEFLKNKNITVKSLDGETKYNRFNFIVKLDNNKYKKTLFLLDNDTQNKNNKDIKSMINNKGYVKDNIHLLTDLKIGETMECYFKEIITGISNELITLEKWKELFDDDENNIINNNIKKFGFLCSDKINNKKLRRKLCENNIVPFSKKDMAKYLMKYHKKEVEQKLEQLIESIKATFEKRDKLTTIN